MILDICLFQGKSPFIHHILTMLLEIIYWIAFCISQNWIGVIDRMHMDVRVPKNRSIAYINCCGSPTKNVMEACNFQLCFTFNMAGWDESAQDSPIFKHAICDPKHNFLIPLVGLMPHNINFLQTRIVVVNIHFLTYKEILSCWHKVRYPMQRDFMKHYFIINTTSLTLREARQSVS